MNQTFRQNGTSDRPWTAHWPPGMPSSLPPPNQTIPDNLFKSAEAYPDKPAIIFYDFEISYAELKSACERLSSYLRQTCKIEKGDRVGLLGQNSPQFIMAYYAILHAGGVVVPINPMNTTSEVEHLITDSGLRTLFCASDIWPTIEPLAKKQLIRRTILFRYADYLPSETDLPVPQSLISPEVRTGVATIWQDALSTERESTSCRISPSDMAVFPYTSGSTGHPKACVHTHATTLHAVNCCHAWFDIRTDDKVLAVAPFFHVTGMQLGMNAPIAKGATIVILPRWDAHTAAVLINRYQISFWPCVPTMVIDLLSMHNFQPGTVSSLRVLMGGGQTLPEAVALKLKALCGLDFIEGYGLSETMAPATANPSHAPKPQCAGIPVFNTDILIVTPDTLRPVNQGETGEILVSGPQVMNGYWNRDSESESALIKISERTYLRTGDIGRLDPEGYLYIVDRLKRMINAAGFKVWPNEVEAALYAHPAVLEACVISSPDSKRGETVKALIVLRPEYRTRVCERDISQWSRQVMSAYKAPKIIEFVDDLPKAGSGKVLWRVLQERELNVAKQHKEQDCDKRE